MTDWLALAARRRPEHPAVLAGGRSVSYAELDARAGELAATLKPGHPVPIAVPPGIEFAELLHATWRAGAVAVPLDPAAGRSELDGLRLDGRTALVIHTSGTTGAPIPVELTLENLEASARASADALGTEPGDRWLCPLPLHHVGGLSVLVRCAVNATTAVLHERFEAKRVKATLEAGEATLASLVPTMLARLREAGLRRAPGLRAIALGGGPVPLGLLEWAAGAGIPVTPVYGMTETASQVVAGIPGRPLAGVELAVTGEGEILVRGSMVARASVDPDGWLHTGDLGRLDAEGLLHVEGRLKELIVTGGENVAPLEIEQVLQAHPKVSDAGVVGLPDPEWGEQVVAFVVLRDGLGADELRDWCRSRLAPHKVPKRFEPVASLPRNANGKLQRERLSQANVESLRAFFATWGTGDAPEFSLLDPDVIFEDNILPDHAGETYRGYDGVVRATRTWLEPYERFTIELERILGSGDRLISIHRFRSRARFTGIEEEMRYAYLWLFRNGKVTYFRSFRDPEQALEAARLGE